MNNIIDYYNLVKDLRNPIDNPLISQYNTVKVALLIYRICYRVGQKKIYSLQTKCLMLQKYITESLCKYFEQ